MEDKCFICQRETPVKRSTGGPELYVGCSHCGRYLIDYKFALTHHWDHHEQVAVAGFIRTREAELDQPEQLVHLSGQSLPEMLRDAPRTIGDKVRRLLRAVERRTRYFGHRVDFRPGLDEPLGYAVNQEEFVELLNYLDQTGFVTKVVTDAPSVPSCKLTFRGAEELERLRTVANASAQGFVAMSFDDDLRPFYEEQIIPGISSAGYRCLRIDGKDYNNSITDEILAGIRESRFVVADFTMQKHGVYFEAGFVLGLGIPVVWICRDDEVDNLHFDTRQYNHLLWTPGDDLQSRLRNRILATIGQGPFRQNDATK